MGLLKVNYNENFFTSFIFGKIVHLKLRNSFTSIGPGPIILEVPHGA